MSKKATRRRPRALAFARFIPAAKLSAADAPALPSAFNVPSLDALDETPVLDVKPYIPHFDSYPDATVPDWLEEHIEHHHERHGHNH